MVALKDGDRKPWWRGAWRRPQVRLAVSLVVLALLLTLFPLEQLWDALRGVPPQIWLACLLLFIGGHALGAFKWRLLISVGGPPTPYLSVFRCYFAGLFANLFLPSIAGGDVVRAGLAMRGSERKEAVVLGSLIDRLLDTLALVLLVLLGSAFSGAALAPTERKVVTLIGVALPIAALAGLLALALPVPGWVPSPVRKLKEKLLEALRRLLRNPGTALFAFTLSMTIQTLFVALNSALGRACGIDLPLTAWMFVWPLAKLLAMAPVSLGGLGVREAALALLLGRFGISAAVSVAVGLAWETVLIAGGLFGGLFYAAVKRSAARTGEEVA